MLLAEGRTVTADAVKALAAATKITIEVPDLLPSEVELGAYDALLAGVGT